MAARTAYDALTDEEKANFDSEALAKLEAVESAFRILDCTDKINKLPDAEAVTASHKNAIIAARAAYDILTDKEKANFDPELLAKLKAAEETLSILFVGEAVTKVTNLPDVEDITSADKAAIEAARKAYDALDRKSVV